MFRISANEKMFLWPVATLTNLDRADLYQDNGKNWAGSKEFIKA